MSQAITQDSIPTSFGTFKPVGHVMLGLPGPAQWQALRAALLVAGFPDEALLHFKPGNAVPELEAMVAKAGPMAGFGYEITLMHRYLALAKEGCQWLLVKVARTDDADRVAELARAQGATLAVHYRSLTVEELI